MNWSVRLMMICLFIAVLTLSSCSGLLPASGEFMDQPKQNVLTAAKSKEDDFSSQSIVQVNPGYFVGTAKKLELREEEKLPSFFAKKITLVERPLKIHEILQRITQITGIYIRLAPSVRLQEKTGGGGSTGGSMDSTGMMMGPPMAAQAEADPLMKEMPVRFNGTFKNLLDLVATNYGLYWEYDNGVISFFKVDTKTFTIATNAGKVEFENIINNRSEAGTSDSSDGHEAKNTGQQMIKISDEFSAWEDVERNILQMLSRDGSVVINKGSGTVTVTDVPSILHRVEQYVAQVNEKLTRQVAITVKVYNLETSIASSHNISLNAVFQALEDSVRAASSGGNLVSLLPGVSNFNAAIVANPGKKSLKDFSGTELLINALETHGDVTLVTSGSGITLNNIPVPIQEVRQIGYLASSATTSTSDAGTTVELEPGQVTVGFTMIATPHVYEGNKVILQYTMTLSSLVDLKQIVSGDQKIEAPEISSRSFMQRVSMRLGSTLFLAGFQQDSNRLESGSGILSIGQRTEKSRNVILIAIEVNDLTGAV